MKDFITIGEPLTVFASEEMDKPLSQVTCFKKYLAGAELNVAIGLARLGYETDYIAQVGKDSLGDFIRSELDKSGVGKDFVIQVADYPTGFYLKEKVSDGDPKVEYFRKGSAASHFELERLESLDFSEVKIAHLTGIMAAISKKGLQVVKNLLQNLSETETITIFDPNLRPVLWESEEVMIKNINDLAKLAKIILPGITEGRLLTGRMEISEIADYYLRQSEITQTVIIKNGSKGAFIKNKNGDSFTVESYKVEQVVDTVGAGDGFAVGFISGLLDGENLQDSVKRACAIGALAVQSAGDNDGYPTRIALEKFVKDNS